MLPGTLLPTLSRVLDVPAQRRLIAGWKDPEVQITALVERFKISSADVESLKVCLGPKAKPEPTATGFIKARKVGIMKRLRAHRAERAGR